MEKEKKVKKCIEYRLIQPSIQMEVQMAIDRIEEEKSEPFYSYYTKWSPEMMIDQFLNSKSGETKDWGLIPKDQYKSLLERFMASPEMARIPDSVVSDWLSRIFKNSAQLISLTKLFGRTEVFPSEVIMSKFSEIDGNDKLVIMNYLHDVGFYKWASNDECGPAWTDFGLMKLYLVLKEYREDMTPEEKLILINRCLDVTHKRGKLACFFLEGGVRTSETISK